MGGVCTTDNEANNDAVNEGIHEVMRKHKVNFPLWNLVFNLKKELADLVFNL